jgi:V8-like Glu-specific endopeptidase
MNNLHIHFQILKERYESYKIDNQIIPDIESFFQEFKVLDNADKVDQNNIGTLELPTLNLIRNKGFAQTFRQVNDILNPIYYIQDDKIVHPKRETIWKTHIANFNRKYKKTIKSTGRIEFSFGNRNLGTGWFIKKNIIVTNSHVAKAINNQPVRIDLKEEFQRAQSLQIDISKILFFEGDENPDIAFLELKNIPNDFMVEPLSLTQNYTYTINAPIALIGYPEFEDTRIAEIVFIDIDSHDKKQFQPGKIRTISNTFFEHDCSTIHGNSGSPVFDINNGNVIGIHFGSFPASRFNGAYKTTEILRLAKELRLL